MLNFCTLFDINFISQGLAMYESLKKHCKKEFTLYIFAFCDESFKLLSELQLEHCIIIPLKEFENEELLNAKKTRTKGEYCWTCASSTILYCLEKYNLPQCTYLDADLYFYSDPGILLDEMGEKSVLITEHRYTPEYDQTESSGKYCVQFVSFKNNGQGLKVLKWWVQSCIEWCYAKFEDNKFGDQKYLDDWMTRFEGVHELKNLGGGVAPWNVQQYRLLTNKLPFLFKEIATPESKFELIFYHFHNIKVEKNESFIPVDGYKINQKENKYLYEPYIKHVTKISKHLHKKNKNVTKINPTLYFIKKFNNLVSELKTLKKNIIKVKFGKEKYLILFGKKII